MKANMYGSVILFGVYCVFGFWAIYNIINFLVLQRRYKVISITMFYIVASIVMALRICWCYKQWRFIRYYLSHYNSEFTI